MFPQTYRDYFVGKEHNIIVNKYECIESPYFLEIFPNARLAVKVFMNFLIS